jgi:hypothetical protein
VKPKKKRIRQPTNLTLDPKVKAAAIKLAEEMTTNLAQLVNELLAERIRAAEREKRGKADGKAG